MKQYRQPDDLVILAGDLVNKGPKSVEVIRLAREQSFLAVLGNHEVASLGGHAKRQGGAIQVRDEHATLSPPLPAYCVL